MKYSFITGTSSGLGKALAEECLKEGYKVFGFSRSNNLENPNYTHRYIDLSDPLILEQFYFPELTEVDEVLLINNSGAITHGHVGDVTSKSMIADFTLNVIAVGVLCNKFIEQYNSLKARKLIINISSGAGKRAVDGWATYCASKAAVDLYTETIAAEQDIQALEFPFEVYAIAPGIVDTAMQSLIRDTDSSKFSSVQKFKNYHKNGELKAPIDVAKAYLKLIKANRKLESVVMRI